MVIQLPAPPPVHHRECLHRPSPQTTHFIALYEECRGFIEGGAEPEKAPHKLAGYLHSLTVKTPPLPGVKRPGRLALLPAHPSDASADAYLRQLGELSIREVVAKGLAVHVAEVIRARELLGGEAAVQIPYHSRIALIEEPFVVTRPDHHVTEQYRKAARAVLGLVGGDPGTHLREATRLISEDKIEESLGSLRRATPIARDEVIQVLRLVTTQVLDARGCVPAWGNDAFLLLTRLDPQDDIAFYNWGNLLSELAQLIAQKDSKAAQDLFHQKFEKYQKAVSIKPDLHEAFNNWGTNLARLAAMIWKDKRKTAEKHLRDAEKRLRDAVSLAPEE